MTFRRRAFSTSALRLTGLALLAAALAGCAHAGKGETPGSGIRFVSDDFAGALARARAEGKPLFVDAWAPWCHSCVSMKSYVFPDAVLSGVADRFVWLEVDTEKPVNRAFVEQFPTEALPTLMVIDPRTGTGLPALGGQRDGGRARGPPPLHRPGADPGSSGHSGASRPGPGERGRRHSETTPRPPPRTARRSPGDRCRARSITPRRWRGWCSGWPRTATPADAWSSRARSCRHVAPGTALATLVATGLSCALELDEVDARRRRRPSAPSRTGWRAWPGTRR